MTKDQNYKEYIYPVIILTAIALVTTALLAITNAISDPIIIRNSIAAANATRQELLADADGFNDITADSELATSPDGSAYISEVYESTNGTGYVMTAHTTSFGGDLTMMVGLDAEGAITGVKVTDHADTPGVGTKDQAPEYLAQYQGKTALTSDNVKKEADFAFISGASVSGTAIHKGVAAALAQYEAIGGGN